MIPSAVGCCHKEPQLCSGWLLPGFQISRNGAAAESLPLSSFLPWCHSAALLPACVVVALGGSSILQHWEQGGSERSPPGSGLSLMLGSVPSLRFTFGNCFGCLLLVVLGGWSRSLQHPVVSQLRQLLVLGAGPVQRNVPSGGSFGTGAGLHYGNGAA